MRIVNETKNAVISDNSEIAHSLLSRARGLMLSRPKDLVLVSPRESIISSTIHMFLMRFSIDVIWLDSENIVVDLRKSVKPFNPFEPDTWKTYKPKNPARYVIELGVGRIGNTEIGDEIKFLYSNAPKSTHQPL